MKTILASLICLTSLFLSHPAHSAPEELVILTDLKAAKEQSKTAGKPVFLEFMSSTCPHCQAFKKNVISDPAFIAYAKKNLIVVIHDYQDLATLPATEKSARETLMTQLKVESFPTILLIDKTGAILFRTQGYSGTPAEKIIDSLKTAQVTKQKNAE